MLNEFLFSSVVNIRRGKVFSYPDRFSKTFQSDAKTDAGYSGFGIRSSIIFGYIEALNGSVCSDAT